MRSLAIAEFGAEGEVTVGELYRERVPLRDVRELPLTNITARLLRFFLMFDSYARQSGAFIYLFFWLSSSSCRVSFSP